MKNPINFSLRAAPRAIGLALALGGMAVSTTAMSAGAIIYNTGDSTTATVALGVNDLGHLNTRDGDITVNASATGVAAFIEGGADGTGWYDATSPGCLCEGWGVAASGVSGYASVDSGGISNLTLDSFTADSSSATSKVFLTSMPDLKVTHAYAPSASLDVFEAKVTIENTSAATMTDLRYRRAMDWDIPFTEFNEYVTIGGTGTTADLLASSDNGFATPDPLGGGISDLAGCGINTDFVDCGPSDHGAVFDFGFGDLAAGESKTFSIFYGASVDEAAAFAALGDIGAELFSFGQESGDPKGGTPRTYIFAFSGVGGSVIVPPPVKTPEPGMLALLGMGLFGLVASRRRRKV